MGRFIKGDIVVLNFPFSDLSGAKRRPALVLADVSGNDLILCQITSQNKTDGYSILLENEDYEKGTLSLKSNVRPNKIFTADENLILYIACKINAERMEKIINSLINILNS